MAKGSITGPAVAMSRTAPSLAPPSTSFVGRAADLDRLDELYGAGARLVTVVGPPGTGKTRLALEYARQRARAARFCDLAAATSRADMCVAVASVLNRSLSGLDAEETMRAIGGQLADGRDEMIILDNFEQIVDCASSTVERWLAGSDARFLVTSRERLRIAGEHTLELLPLRLTDDAVQLFVDRARAVRSGFARTAANAPLLAEIVGKLDGIPLAIELAAARVSAIDLERLRELLPDLDVLAHGFRDADERQASMRGAIEWSWRLLEPWQQAALVQCSVFHGGFDLDAVAGVVDLGAFDAAPRSSVWALDVAQALRDQSLIYPVAPDEHRFALYQSVRAFAREKLAELDEAEQVSERHASYFVATAGGWADDVFERGVTRPIARIAGERSNLVALCRNGPLAHRVSAAVALHPLLAARGPADEHVDLLEHAMAGSSEADVGGRLWARALLARSQARRNCGHTSEAAADLELALRLAEQAEDHVAVGRAHMLSARLARRGGSDETAQAHYELALAALRRVPARRLELLTLSNLGNMMIDRGQLDAAQRHLEQALVAANELDEPRTVALIEGNLGCIDQERGDMEKAATHYRSAMRGMRDLAERRLEGIALGHLAAYHHERGALRQAKQGYVDALRLLVDGGEPVYQALFLAASGAIDAAMGDLDSARRAFDRASSGPAIPSTVGHCIDVYHRHVVLARAEAALAAEDEERARELREQATRADPRDTCTFAARLAHRLLRNAIGDARAFPAAAPNRLAVARDALWYRVGASDRVDLRSHRASRLVLSALVAQRLGRPGLPLSREQVFAAGWPGETVQPAAAANRARVTIAGLRKQGLDGILLRQDDGYLLDPDVPVLDIGRIDD